MTKVVCPVIRVTLLGATCACAHPTSTVTGSPSPVSAAATSHVPSQVGRYRVTSREGVEGFPNDSAFRFSDGSATRVTVFVYAISPDVQVGPDSQSWTVREGRKFQEVQPIRVQQGQIEAFNLAFANTGEITAANRRITESAMAIAVRLHGRVAVDFQYLYLVAGRFLKVRATVPSEGWERTDVPTFARELARQIALADTVRGPD